IPRRIRRFFEFVRPDAGIFSLSQMPMELSWGAKHASRVLCSASNGSPISIWVVGTLSRLTVSCGTRDMGSTTELVIEFLRSVDQEQHGRLLLLGRSSTEFRATRRSRVRSGAQLLDAFYDATSDFTDKTEMLRVSPTFFAVGDVVLAECMCIRRKRDPGCGSRDWSSWGTEFELVSMSVLSGVPRRLAPIVRDTFTDHL
ncbi:hypothetical protein C8Q79DRAFT_902827, partial [Trametes meyenii]